MNKDTLAHIEKTLSESYRKEVDQEENIWRSLPFFAATIALQLAALSQLLGHLPPARSIYWWVTVVISFVIGTLLLCALGVLVRCILWEKFRYLSKDTELLKYANELMETESQVGIDNFDSLEHLKRELAHQYSLASDNNRRINKRREERRVLAGILIISSMAATIILLALILGFEYVHREQAGGDTDASQGQCGHISRIWHETGGSFWI